MKNNIYRVHNASSWVVRWRVNGVKKSKSFSDKKFVGRAKAYEQAEAFLKIRAGCLTCGVKQASDFYSPLPLCISHNSKGFDTTKTPKSRQPHIK